MVMRKVIVLEFVSLDGVIQAPAAQRKIPVVVSRMAGGQLPMTTMFQEQS
jgi:hypothetical protein